jgi:MFS family permease
MSFVAAVEPWTKNAVPLVVGNEWRSGWRVLLSSAVGVGVGTPAVINTAGLFIVPMQEAFGWSRTAIAIGPIVGIISSCLSPLGGWLIDRFGARPVALVGLSLLCAELLLLALVRIDAATLYALAVALGVSGVLANNIVYCKAVATWFRRRTGTAIALMLSGVSVMGAIMQPLVAHIISRYGWRAGYGVLAAFILLAGLPLLWRWFRENPAQVAKLRQAGESVMGATVPEAIRDRRFWLILAAFAGAAVPIGGFVNQLQPLLVDQGHVPTAAALLVSIFLIATGGGRIVAGVLFDYFRPSRVAASVLCLSAVGAAILGVAAESGISWSLAAAAVTLIGLAQGAEADFIALFTLRSFGLRRFSTLVAIIFMVSGIGFAFGGLMFARIFDRSGGYQPAIFISAAILLAAAVIAMTIRVPGPQTPVLTGSNGPRE